MTGRLAILLAAAPWLGSFQPAVAAEPVGWLGDGTGHFEGALVPLKWSKTSQVAWTTPMPAWGNASPVVVGKRVFVTAEPLTLMCASTEDGRVLWRHEVSYLDAVDEAERATVRQAMGEAKAVSTQLLERERALQKLKRDLRKARGAADIKTRIEAILEQVNALKDELGAFDHLRPPPPIPQMGTSPSTPLSDGRALYGVFGNGIVASFDLDGQHRWGRFLGRPEQKMRGYHRGQAASPLLVDGLLIVAMNHLMALDPATGKTIWKGDVYLDFGPPRPTRIDGTTVLVTPSGLVVRARDGEVLARDIGGVYYVSPSVDGRHVYFVGAEQDPDSLQRMAHGVRLTGSPDSLRAESLWRTQLTPDKTYATPLLHKGLLYALGVRGLWTVVDAATGKVVYEETLDLGREASMSSPVVAGDRIVVASLTGKVAVIRAGRTFELLALTDLEPLRATATLVGKRMYLRGFEKLWAIDGARAP